MWSVGCMFASMVSILDLVHIHYSPFKKIFRKEHFFRGSDNDDQLLKIMKTLVRRLHAVIAFGC